MADEGDNVLEVLPSRNQGHIKLAMNGFIYTKHNETSDRISWRCHVIRGNKDTGRTHCGGRINTDTACLQAEVVQHHRHPPNHAEVVMMKMQHLFSQRLAEIHGVDVTTVLKTPMRNLKLEQAVSDVLEKMTDGEKEYLPPEEDCVYQCSVYLRNRRYKGADGGAGGGGLVKAEGGEMRKLYSGDEGDNILETFDTRNGFTKVALNGFVYTKHSETDDKIRWRCVEKGCPGRANSDLESLHAQSTHGHVHPPDGNMVECMRVRRALKARLLRPESAYRTYADIVDELMGEVRPELRETVVQRKTLLVFAKNLAHKQGLKRLHKKGKRGASGAGAVKGRKSDEGQEMAGERLQLPSSEMPLQGPSQAAYPPHMQTHQQQQQPQPHRPPDM